MQKLHAESLETGSLDGLIEGDPDMNGHSPRATSVQSPGRDTRKGRRASPLFVDAPDEFAASSGNGTRCEQRRHIAFGWYGGKFSHLGWLLPLLPECHHYCEPFAGSAAVLLNRPPSPVETYNDIDGEVVNFFRTLRDAPEALKRGIALTPFSREEYHLAIYGNAAAADNVERARRFYVRARQTRTGLAQTASLGRWANCKDTSRAGMSGVVSRWPGGIHALDAIAQRLLRVQIENRPAIDIIKLYDSPRTLFYCDPPYLHATRGDSKAYGFEMDEAQHREFAEVVNCCAGKVAISGYEHPIMEAFFPREKWFKTRGKEKTIHSTKDTRREVLWTNYNPQTQEEIAFS
ncbi:MAG: DNA adenine methylase [Puniceicoccales bacterium]|jgi:DNA adenine methylase|nr:DNA adenine methylase [Puniceicoccales bacterium]